MNRIMRKNYENFKKFVDFKTDGFQFGSQAEEEFYKNIVNYFGEGDTIYNRNKGLLIRGAIGVGKTSFLKLIQFWLNADDKFAYNTANDVVSMFNSRGDEGVEKYKKIGERMFDDIGAEDLGRYYGNSVEVFEKIIYSRYDLYKYQGVRTHFTSNLNNEGFSKKYGDRAYDRLKEMCNLVNWVTVDSKRGSVEFTIKQAQKEEVQISEEEKEKRCQEGMKAMFETYKETGEIVGASNIVYERLQRDGVLPIWDPKELEMAEDLAKKNIAEAQRNSFTKLEIHLQNKSMLESSINRILLGWYYDRIINV